ncbi:MAG: glycoside hydrolase family 2 TIM barrel-domain containing protein, partial [Sphaerochaetaceae bacterium]|nr:glycoside hydrolase family 2 TIM barrel-domain containing protein [Sphaerochaetaceae bacterium]
VLPKTYIEKAHIATDFINAIYDDEMLLSLDLEIKQSNEEQYQIRVSLIDDGKEIKNHIFKDKIISNLEVNLKVKNIELWEVDNPKLYQLRIEILKADKIVDTVVETFGFRTVRFTPEGFLLNNKPLKLIGLNRHQSYPYVGYAMPKSLQELDATILKNYGCNIVRTSHYMQSDHFLNKCDSLGLLVLEEVPGWQYIGNQHFKDLTLENLEAMITAHYNHPSIITWGVRINESFDDHDFYEMTNELARKLDPTRQTSGIRNTKKGEPLEDIYTYNDFSHTGNNAGLAPIKSVLPKYMPYLVTEHNGHVFPTKKTDTEDYRKSQAMRHTTVIDHAYSSNRYSGAIGWCLADYNTHFNFGSNDRICHHGVMDMFRIPKYAAFAYKSQTENEVVLEVASNMIPGDYREFKLPETIVFTNCDYIKLYKNNQYVGEYYPDYDNFPNLPYPPIIFDDYLGELIINSGKYTLKNAKRITKLINNFYRNDFKVKPLNALRYLLLKRKTLPEFKDVMEIFEEYVAMQKTEPVAFKFEGYLNDELVITKSKGQTKEALLKATLDHQELIHGFTYDATRLVVRLVDEYDNDLQFSNDVVSVSVSENLEVIGPKNLSLTAGSTAFYLKTRKPGLAEIIVKSSRNQVVKLALKVNKGAIEK